MPIIKIKNKKSYITNTGITSSNVSSSVSGNINLIESQINEKKNTYINTKNAVQILEKHSNWNGYIKLFTEVESNFNVNDIIYITYTSPTIDNSRIFSLDNNYNNVTAQYYDNPFDENVKEFSFGYKVLYTNKYKNEIVINRNYDDIKLSNNSGQTIVLSDQSLSKVTFRKGTFFDKIADGVVFYGGDERNCNIFNSDFSIVQGTITYDDGSLTGATLSGVTILCSGLLATNNNNGYYTISLPIGLQTIKFYADGFITHTEILSVSGDINELNIRMSGGTNSVEIYGINEHLNAVCPNGSLTYYATVVGYTSPMIYLWQINRNGFWFDVGLNSPTLSYNQWQDGDILRCDVKDERDILNNTYTSSQEITISILTKSLTISVSPSNVIDYGTLVTFSADALCYDFSSYQWYLNILTPVGTNSPIYTNSTLDNNDLIHCVVNGDLTNYIQMEVTYPPTTTVAPSTTVTPTTTPTP